MTGTGTSGSAWYAIRTSSDVKVIIHQLVELLNLFLQFIHLCLMHGTGLHGENLWNRLGSLKIHADSVALPDLPEIRAAFKEVAIPARMKNAD